MDVLTKLFTSTNPVSVISPFCFGTAFQNRLSGAGNGRRKRPDSGFRSFPVRYNMPQFHAKIACKKK
jgi:hypothetical protein